MSSRVTSSGVMSSNANRRLLVTALVLAWFGAFAAAAAVGQGWGAAVPLAVAAIPMAIVYYVWGGRDSDFAALLVGRRADERQALIRTRARALAGNAMYAIAVIGTIGALTLPDNGGWRRNWPFAVVVVVGTISYWWAGRDSGLGVLAGGRADERQALIRTRARALAGNTMYAAAAVGAAVELDAARHSAPGELLVVLADRRGRRRCLSGRAAPVRGPRRGRRPATAPAAATADLVGRQPADGRRAERDRTS